MFRHIEYQLCQGVKERVNVLKKQTVWLLTLLSLMIVLSVYYMNSPNEEDFAFIFQEDDEESTEMTNNEDFEIELSNETIDEEAGEVDEEVESNISSITSDEELFTLIRMELAQTRSSRIEQLETVVASSTASTEEKNKAYDEMKKIDQLSTKELIVEETLKSEYDYADVLVRSMDENVVVTVKTDQLSETEANQIMRMVYDEFGPMQVEVKFQPSQT
nr:SpoIIIAH-like family protein [Amphibacillus cookii]